MCFYWLKLGVLYNGVEKRKNNNKGLKRLITFLNLSAKFHNKLTQLKLEYFEGCVENVGSISFRNI